VDQHLCGCGEEVRLIWLHLNVTNSVLAKEFFKSYKLELRWYMWNEADLL
jgi:hypothetical protein